MFEPDAAYIVWKFFGTEPFVYLPDTEPYSLPREQWPAWLKQLAAHAKFISREDIWANPAGYMLQNSYPHILELLGLPNTARPICMRTARPSANSTRPTPTCGISCGLPASNM